jgi:hemolysin III
MIILMTRTKLSDREMPKYTKGEEIFHMASHIVGGAFGVAALSLCVIFAALNRNGMGIISGAIYGFTLVLLYTMSSIYHGLKPELFAKRVFQVLDHCSIFLLIAGTYTPFALAGILPIDAASGWWIFGIIWGAAILGIVLNSIDIKRFKKFSMVCYLAMGWCIVVRADLLPQFMPAAGIWLLILGGVSYTIGAAFYGLGKKKKWTHSLWHLFILVGSVLHFLCILLFVM